MPQMESGVIAYDSPSSQRIEAFARFAYSLSDFSPATPPGTGDLLDSLTVFCRIEEVDLGIPAGTAEVEFGSESVLRVRVCGRQSAKEMTLACARACAMYVAWVRCEEWSDRLIDAVALAIAMPEEALRAELACGFPLEELAARWVIAPELVTARIKMLSGQHESGERRAVSMLAP